MKSFLHLVKNFRNFVFKIKYLEKGYPSAAEALNMTDNNSDTDTPPKKKLCVEQTEENLSKEKPSKRRKVALLLSYIGDNYFGMQRNPEVTTIEGELLKALSKVDAIPLTAVNDPHEIGFQRTARTDKSVSAIKQLVSLRMVENTSVESINKHLPEDIKVLSIKRVTKGFQCQAACSGRVYSYTLPTFALAPEFHKEYPQDYRISQQEIQKANDILLTYVGTHNFHNFTSKKNFKDPSAKRYILNFSAGKPFIGEGEEFITLTVKGQSFMLHQIRKMVGHMIATLKGVSPPNMVNDVWSEEKYSVPMAPGLGLVLEDVLFCAYNRKYENDGIHESLTFDEFAEEISDFKKKVLGRIVKKEIEEKVMFNWLMHIQSHSYKIEDKTLNEENG